MFPFHFPSKKNCKKIIHVLANLIMVVGMLTMTTGCGMWDDLMDTIGWGKSVTERTLNVLDNGIARFENDQEDWKNILNGMQSKLTKDAQSTIRTEINQLMQRTVDAVSTEIKCLVDFARARVLQDLIRIRAEFLGVDAPAKEPYICVSNPTFVDMNLSADRRNIVELYGFDFDTSPAMKVVLQDSNRTIDVSNYLDRPSHYLMTLNLGGNGIPLSKKSQKIKLSWNGEEMSTIAIVQPATPVCDSLPNQSVTPVPVTYMPPLTHGDRDFNGHGPDITVSVLLKNNGNKISLYISMFAQETQPDRTTASGGIWSVVYTARTGWSVSRILTPLEDTKSYRDDDHAPDNFAGNGPVAQYSITGDTKGDDAGVETQVYATFNEIKFDLVQVANCVSPESVVGAAIGNLVSVSTIERLAPSVPNLLWERLDTKQWQLLKPEVLKILPNTILPRITP